MDRSYLSNQEVVAASRKFVCVRLATYEDKEELAVLKRVFVGPGGDLQNTVFAVLTPDGATKLTRAGRSPGWEWRNGSAMAAGLRAISKTYPGKKTVMPKDLGMPYIKNVRLALNMAEADERRLLVVSGNSEERARLEARLLPLIWGQEQSAMSRFAFVASKDLKDLATIKGASDKAGILVVQPGLFGQSGKQVAHLAPTVGDDVVRVQLRKAAKENPARGKDAREHNAIGRALGIDWKTETPVTDGHGNGRGRDRGRRGRRGPPRRRRR